MKKLLCFMAAVLSLVMMTPSFASAAVSDEQFDGIINSESVFVKEENEDGGDIIKHKDPSVTIPAENEYSGKLGASSVPAVYDLREHGLITSVKNQEPYNFCWSFASVASMESNLIKKGIADKNIDLSEAHLAYFNFHGKSNQTISKYAGSDQFIDVARGFSNYYSACSTLARRYGTVKESEMPYSVYGEAAYNTEKKRTKSQYIMTGMKILETSSSKTKLDWNGIYEVERTIMSNGAVASQLNSDLEIKKTLSDGRKCCYSNSSDPDHAVTIAGWDNINELWLVKNSYGLDDPYVVKYGDKGYMWVSMHSPSINSFYSFSAEKNDGRQMYQYDGTGLGDTRFTSLLSDKFIAANTFKARKDVLIDQASAWTVYADTKVNIKVYLGGSPMTGRKVLDKNFKISSAGYNTIDLGKRIGVPKGTKFSIAISEKSGGKYVTCVEMGSSVTNDIYLNPIKKGQSYYYYDKKWIDVKKAQPIKAANGAVSVKFFNAAVKALGKNAGSAAQSIKVKAKKSMKKGAKLNLKAKSKKGNGKLYYQSSDSKKATVSSKGIVKAKKSGTVKVTVWASPTSKCRSVSKTVKVKIK